METICTYTRAEAIEDGTLIDVSSMAREAGFRLPCAVTATVWVRYVDHSQCANGLQDTKGRLWDILCMAALAARKSPSDSRIQFGFYCVPNKKNHRAPKPFRLFLDIGPGDDAAPVLTIMDRDDL